MKKRKSVTWVGSSKKDLRALPKDVRSEFGYSLDLVQREEKDPDSKPMKGFNGASVLEITKKDGDGTYRTVYTVKFKEAIYVLHVKIGLPKRSVSTIAR